VWRVPLVAVRCDRCGEAHLVPEAAIPARCPICLRGQVALQPAYLRDEPPEQVLPYKVRSAGLKRALERWSEGIWFRPADLQVDVLARRAQRYLVPLWLVDGRVEGAWRADVGFDYQVVSSQDRYREGAGWRSQKVEETRVRWEPRVGRIERRYENMVAPALDDHHRLMARLGQFEMSERVSYSPEAVEGSAVRIPSLEPDAAWPQAEPAFVRTAEADCRRAAGADHIRDFRLDAAYSDLNWTQLLLPAYVSWYEEGDEVWPVLVNGQTGRVSGVRRASARKARTTAWILGGIGVLLFLVGGVLALLGGLFPPLVAVGMAVLIVGVMLGLAAPVPPIAVWRFNRQSAGRARG
ncbi:MAG: hypothetical protein PVI59_16880, partial [Anaerolineae bacterium]